MTREEIELALSEQRAKVLEEGKSKIDGSILVEARKLVKMKIPSIKIAFNAISYKPSDEQIDQIESALLADAIEYVSSKDAESGRIGKWE